MQTRKFCRGFFSASFSLFQHCRPGRRKPAAFPRKAGARAFGSPADGDRIVFGTIGEASNLITYLSTDSASHEVADLIFTALLRYNKNLEPEAWAAEWYRLEDGGKRMLFRLRKGILWEDGVELTAEDVAFTYRLVIDPKTASPYAEDFLRVKELNVLDRYTIEVIYEEFFARTYRLKEWQSGSRIVLEASETYFGGRPHIDEVIYRIIPDDATMFMELRAGRLDVMNLNPLQSLRQTSGNWWDNEFHKYRYLAPV